MQVTLEPPIDAGQVDACQLAKFDISSLATILAVCEVQFGHRCLLRSFCHRCFFASVMHCAVCCDGRDALRGLLR